MARRSGLGKGLGALIPTETTTSSDDGEVLREVPLTAITANRFQPRQEFDNEQMAALTASIRELGVLQPILVRPLNGADDTFELIAGERRLRAAKRAGLVTIPVLVRAQVSDQSSLEQALVENLQRADLNAIEEAEAYQRLIDEFGLTHDEAATRVGKSRTTVTNTLRLLQLPKGVQSAIQEGAVSAGHGRALLASPDRALQEASRADRASLWVHAVEELLATRAPAPVEVADEESPTSRPPTAPPSPAGRRPDPPAPGVLELEELLSNYLDTRVEVEVLGRRGRGPSTSATSRISSRSIA